MSTKAKTETVLIEDAGGMRSEPVGRAEQPAGGAPSFGIELSPEVRDRLADEVIDELLAGARTEEEIVGPGGVLAQLTKRLVERAMAAELTEHLGYEPDQEPPGGAGNTRNGSTAKTLATEHGPVRIETPRDRRGSFEPQIGRKGQRRFQGFYDKIVALYSRGLSTRDIEAHLAEIYGVQVGRDLISRVTDAVIEDVREWQQRPLDDVYPIVFLDALVLKIREGGTVQRKACYLALGVTIEGERDVLGMWFGGQRGRQVLDAGPQRAQAARRPRHPDLLRRRAEGLPGSDRSDLPGDDGADLHRPPDPAQPQVRAAQGARAGRARPEADLYRRRPRRRPGSARCLRRQVAIPLPGDHAGMAERLGVRDPVSGVSARGAPRRLYDERDRGAQPPTAQSDQDERTLPQRGGRQEADLSRHRQRRAGVDTNAQLDDSPTRVQDPLRRPTTRVNRLHSKSDALSGSGWKTAEGERSIRGIG